MLSSAEVRWFYEGAVPPDVIAWFHRGERQPVEQPRRVDYYLHPGSMDALGIKLREGRIEVKQRQRLQGVVHFHERVSGVVEGWRKWSFALAAAHSLAGDVGAPASSWIGVQKQRLLHNYRLVGEGQLVVIPGEDYSRQICHLELTRIQVRGTRWWSLGFEALGPESALEENLSLVIAHVLAQEPVPTLATKNSYGYPKWLQVITQADSIPPLHPPPNR